MDWPKPEFSDWSESKIPRLNYKIEVGSPEAKHASGPQNFLVRTKKGKKRLKGESEQPFKQKGWEQTHHRSNRLGVAVTELEDAEEDRTETILLVQLNWTENQPQR